MDEIEEHLQRAREADDAIGPAREKARQLVAEAVTRRAEALRQAHAAGATWAQIGERLGVSLQRAQQMSRQGRDQ